MRLRLAVGDREVDLPEGESILGRGDACDIVLVDRSVSRRHAAIVVSATGAAVRDLESRNGTWVNGLRLSSDRRLRGGDRIQLGVAVLWVLQAYDERTGHDDGWVALQAALLVKASTAGKIREADEVVFRLAEAIEARISMSEPFASDVADAALASIIDYANVRGRPGWVRWAIAVHAKLGTTPGPAVQRALDSATPVVEETQRLRSSGSIPARPGTSVPSIKIRSA
jgi:predicted component of type VI protein secretion system